MNEVISQINPVYLLAKFSKGTRNFSFDVGSVFAQKSFEILFQPKVQKNLRIVLIDFNFLLKVLKALKVLMLAFVERWNKPIFSSPSLSPSL